AGRIDDSMHSGPPAAVRPALHHVAQVDHELTRARAHIAPLPIGEEHLDWPRDLTLSTASGAQGPHYCTRIRSDDPQQGPSRPFRYTAPLLPVPQGRAAHAYQQGKLSLRFPDALRDGADICWLDAESL